jgi:hypothetical protein
MNRRTTTDKLLTPPPRSQRLGRPNGAAIAQHGQLTASRTDCKFFGVTPEEMEPQAKTSADQIERGSRTVRKGSE